MRALTVPSLFLIALGAASATKGPVTAAEADTTLHIVNSVGKKALVVDAGMGEAINARGDFAIRAHGSQVGLRAEADYFAIEASARNGVGVAANGSTGVAARGDWAGITAAGASAGLIAGAAGGGIGVNGSVEFERGMGVWGLAGYGGRPSRGSAGVAGNGLGEGSAGVSGVVEGPGAVAVMGNVSGESRLAGLFQGDVVITGACDPCVPANGAMQKDARPITGALAKLMALKPKSFEWKTEEFDSVIVLSKGRRYGFTAEEVRRVVPEMVHEAQIPARLTPTEQWNMVAKEPVTLKALNYNDLIPLLVQAIQEQQVQIEALKRR